MPTPTVRIFVDKFVDAVTPQGAPGSVALGLSKVRLVLENGGSAAGVTMKGMTLQVFSDDRMIHFLFDDPGAYDFLDVAFYYSGTKVLSTPDPHATRNITDRARVSVGGQNRFKIKVNRGDKGYQANLDEVKWKYSIFFKETNSGRIGIIDPEISNTETENLRKPRK